uniref:ANAPC4_WD40 domain-containing protein n=1 Tax=Macrostomum lignano TaxID=282301 RepID=A0A1I8HAM5_9PLAT
DQAGATAVLQTAANARNAGFDNLRRTGKNNLLYRDTHQQEYKAAYLAPMATGCIRWISSGTARASSEIVILALGVPKHDRRFDVRAAHVQILAQARVVASVVVLEDALVCRGLRQAGQTAGPRLGRSVAQIREAAYSETIFYAIKEANEQMKMLTHQHSHISRSRHYRCPQFVVKVEGRLLLLRPQLARHEKAAKPAQKADHDRSSGLYTCLHLRYYFWPKLLICLFPDSSFIAPPATLDIDREEICLPVGPELYSRRRHLDKKRHPGRLPATNSKDSKDPRAAGAGAVIMMSTVFPYTMPCQVRQLALLEAGCQPWSSDTLACSPDASRFAFAATLAVYVYEQAKPGGGGPYQLVSVMAQHKKTVTSLSWHPADGDLFVSASLDPLLLVWNVRKQAPLPRHGAVGFLDGGGPLMLWNYSGAAGSASQTPAVHKETQALASQVTIYRWHPAGAANSSEAAGRIALGHEDGTLSVVRPGKKALRRVSFLEAEDDLAEDEEDAEDTVLGLEWDALSPNFLLVDSRCNGLRLVDVDAQTTSVVFQLPSAASPAHSLAWLPSAPGLFVAGDSATGVLRLYSVSRATPIDNIRVKKSGFRNLRVLASTGCSAAPAANCRGRRLRLDGRLRRLLHRRLRQPSGATACRDCLLLCAFLDGGVGLYDVQRRDWHFLREMGHVETVFDCEFSPRDESLLATGSFDGTVKLWRISGAGFSPVQSSPDNEGIVYSIAWSPDGARVAGATAKNGIFVLDVATGCIDSRFTEHGQQAVYCVSWSAKAPHHLASASADCTCVVRDDCGRLARRLSHPAAVYGVAWHQHSRDILATACEDKAVRIFYLASAGGDRPNRVFTGHASKVFGVRWSPLRESYLCSGSDDGTIRVWDCTAEKSVAHLKGHTGPVRGLVWHPELAYMLVSGSWDCHIHCWDIRDGSCLAAVTDHRSDVYGLALHPRRPMLLASCSRDSTLRLWSLAELAGPLPACLLFRGMADSFILPAEAALRQQPGQPALSGSQSRRLLRDAGSVVGSTSSCGGDQLVLLLHASPAAGNLHDLQRALAGTPTAALGDSYGRPGSYVAAKDLLKFQAARAQQLELAASNSLSSSASVATAGRPTSRHRQLRDAAAAHLRCGNLRRYCELQAQLGRWERALALAPGVSQAFWRELCHRYMASQRSLELDDLVAFSVATGAADSAAQLLSRRGKYSDALMVAQAAHEGLFAGPDDPDESREYRRPGVSSPDRLRTAWGSLADSLFQRGAPVDAACCHLAIGDVGSAVGKLLRGNELDLALWLATRVDGAAGGSTGCPAWTPSAGRSCWPSWRSCTAGARTSWWRSPAASRLGSAGDIDAVHRVLGLPGLDACLEIAERLRADAPTGASGTPESRLRLQLDIVGHYLLSPNPLAGLEFGLAAVRDILNDRDSPWTLNCVEALVELMSCARTGKLQQASAVQEKNELLFLATYLGALKAIRQGYHSVVAPLFRHARLHFERHKDAMAGLGRALTGSLLDKELHAWKLMRRSGGSADERHLPEEMRPVWRGLVRKCAGDTGLEVGEDVAAGSALPYHSDFDNCFFMEKANQGAGVLPGGRPVHHRAERCVHVGQGEPVLA